MAPRNPTLDPLPPPLDPHLLDPSPPDLVLVTIPWAGRPNLIKFHSIDDNNCHQLSDIFDTHKLIIKAEGIGRSRGVGDNPPPTQTCFHGVFGEN